MLENFIRKIGTKQIKITLSLDFARVTRYWDDVRINAWNMRMVELMKEFFPEKCNDVCPVIVSNNKLIMTF